ncbi:hypothetical protein BLA60_38470 [Actinophytocola xinjiangensis]|uniref:Uncharacterized protein n=1 Tax=Actinophytocola xinjiangensis TaxID=485602 RepID=A0A7Z0WDR1_9PSEU|nr:hypothetical protein [Actinophytocola xinjiangensis]OLF04977.1 hypothetical protein BLA60_38470 [Actinophytocola xinjiangensis]
MDRLTTGRRHVRAGSVHVTELINRQALRPGAPAPLAAPPTRTPDHARPRPTRPRPAAAEPTEPLERVMVVEPGSHRRPPSRGAQLAKLTSLGAATLVLCAAIATGAAISHQRSGETAADRPALRITGDQAMLPDQLERSLPTSGAARPPAPAATPAPEPVETTTPSPTASAPVPPAATVTAEAPRAVAPPVAAPMSDVALVRKFYELLPANPDSAFDLLAPDLLSSTLGEFLDSWSTVRRIDVLEVREHAEGVIAVVRLALADGGAMRVEQLLTVADSPRWITGAQLLSAQRN